MISVIIVDDHDIVREGLKMILSLNPNIRVVAEASNGREALEIVHKQRPDVVLLDIRMPVMDGVQTTKVIKDLYPQIKIIILTTFNEDTYIFEALKNGADGYILKDVKSDEIIKGIETVYSGNILLQPEVATIVVRELAPDIVKKINGPQNEINITSIDNKWRLTPRELEIARSIAEGKSNQEIADALFISKGTVRNHISSILNKLELRDRIQIAIQFTKRNEIKE